ncbi:MAG: flagellar biosynthesis protein FlhB [Planctomycetota bacterium]
MAETNGQEKTEQATPRKRQKARQEGQVAKSQDLSAAASLAAAMILLYLFGRHIFVVLLASTRTLLGGDLSANPTRMDDLGAMSGYAGSIAVHALGPVLVGLMLVAILAGLGQVGFLLTGKPLVPKFSKLNPLQGAKNLANLRAGIRFLQSLGKLAVVMAVGYVFIIWQLPTLIMMPALEPAQAMGLAAWLVFQLAVVLSVLLIFLAIADYAYQRWQQEQDLKMTKEEVRREMKDMDGDPLVKQRRARVARQLAMQRVAAAVPQADVIVTNPTHYAVALKYDSTTMRAPKVVAKGADFLALRIRQLAAVHGVPLVERKPLARALYGGVEVGQEVPAEHYAAVAEILAYVYRLGGKKAG